MNDNQKIIISNDLENQSFRQILYHSACGVCGSSLTWEAQFDADGTTYVAQCCHKTYFMSIPLTVDITVQDTEEETKEEKGD